MRFRCVVLFLLFLIVPQSAFTQDEETRQGTGLPSMIGENAARGGRMNLSGRIILQGVDRTKRLPVVRITAQHQGSPLDNTVANDEGYYTIRNIPRDNLTVVIEIDGTEVAREYVIPSGMGNTRVDLTIPWPAAGAAKAAVVVAPVYARNEKNEALFQNAITAIKAKENKRAVDLLSEILQADAKDFVAWTELGTVFFRASSLDNAEAAYFKAIQLKRDFVPALLNLGKLYVSKSKFDDAILVLTNAVKAAPDSADARHYLGESYLQIKKGSLAVVELNEAIRLAPQEKAELHLRLATLYDAAGHKARAADEYRAFLAKRPDHSAKSALQKYISEHSKK